MSAKQFEKYVAAYGDVKMEHKDYDTLAKNITLNKYWQGARRYSNMMFNFDSTVQLSEFSVKMPPLLAKIEEFPNQKHYVYSAFYENRGTSQGILEIARQLEAKGYVKLTLAEAKAKTVMTPAKRYILALNSELGEGAAGTENMKMLMRAWNDKSNSTGDNIHVFLASQNYNEGLDMKDVRHIHMFEPLVTMASDVQTIGRARRYCSHANLDHDQWTVQIHRYFADLPVEVRGEEDISKALDELLSKDTSGMGKKELAVLKKEIKNLEQLKNMNIKAIDDLIYTEAKKRMRDLFLVYKSMEESAIDCIELEKFHSASRGAYSDFKCI
jgi:hypothetical protein